MKVFFLQYKIINFATYAGTYFLLSNAELWCRIQIYPDPKLHAYADPKIISDPDIIIVK